MSAQRENILTQLRNNWRSEILAGFCLFLIALPLSVGIAIASGAPPAAGIIAAVVGGVIGAIFTGSYVTINGPAAGLTVIVLASIELLGKGDPILGYKLTLAAIVAAGLVQIVLGLLNIGSLGLIFPTAAVHGLLTAIGAIIIAKQLHLLLGVTPQAKSIVGLIGELPHSLANLNPAIALIGVTSLVILVFWSKSKVAWTKRVPAPLVAVIFGTVGGLLLDIEHAHRVRFFHMDFGLDPHFLLSIPRKLGGFIVGPDFSQIMSLDSVRMIITIALVASVESVLSAHAVDKLDPLGRKSDLNKELKAKGVCNIISGSLGGLPIIAEILRSSANVSNGATTRWSNFFHGVFIALFVALFPQVLGEIPLASLAAVLVFVGFRLAHPNQFKHMWHLGWDQFTVFATTVVTCLMTDILVGVSVGFALELFLNSMRSGHMRGLFQLNAAVKDAGDHALVSVRGPVVFSNFLKLKKTIDSHVGKKNIQVNLRSARLIDHTVMEHLKSYKDAHDKTEFSFDVHFSNNHQAVTIHPLSGRYRLKPKKPAASVQEVADTSAKAQRMTHGTRSNDR